MRKNRAACPTRLACLLNDNCAEFHRRNCHRANISIESEFMHAESEIEMGRKALECEIESEIFRAYDNLIVCSVHLFYFLLRTC